ncbi:MAG: aminotransferase class I/II-fold pyridoxal phosphate-dependent enzyme [Ktedonobacterales bacterium]|nr:aminotransferase class I/II-fold pyridoxal phosphate-dependent enzyme [Ktedonobacterales bacterium]
MDVTADAPARATHREFLAERVRRVKPSGIRRFFDIAAAMPDVISLGIGEPDFTTPRHICEAAIASINAGDTHYTSNYGTVALREAIAQELATRYGLTYDPQGEIMVTVGVSEALDDALRALVDPGDEVLVPDPGYVAYEAGIIFAGGVPVPVPTRAENDFEPLAADFASRVTSRTKAILIGSPNNPTGAVISRTQMEAIAQLAIAHDLVVLSDEIYSRLIYGSEHVSIATLPGMWERTVTLNGFSKAYAMTGWRVGYAAAPRGILEAMLKVHQYAIMCAPTDAQAAALQALRHGEADVAAMVAEYTRRRTLIVEGFNRIGLPCHAPRGAFYAFPDITSTGLSAEDFTERLLTEEQVAVVPGSAFGEAGTGFVRSAYCVAYDKLEEALTRIERFVTKQRG